MLETSSLPGPIGMRAYRERDLDAVIALVRAAIRDIASADYDPPRIEAWSRIDRQAFAERRRRGIGLVATRGGALAGFGELEPDGRVAMLYVDPAHRRSGVARRLLAALVDEAARRGLDTLSTEASLTARPFLESQGWSLVAAETATRHGQRFLRYRMRKALVRPRPAPDR